MVPVVGVFHNVKEIKIATIFVVFATNVSSAGEMFAFILVLQSNLEKCSRNARELGDISFDVRRDNKEVTLT